MDVPQRLVEIVRRSEGILGMEARVGIEPTHKGFADLSLTAWVPRHLEHCTAGPDGYRFGDCDFPTISPIRSLIGH